MRLSTTVCKASLFFCTVIVGACASHPVANSIEPNETKPDKINNVAIISANDVEPALNNSESATENPENTDVRSLETAFVSPQAWSDVGAASPLVLRAKSEGGTHLSAGDPIRVSVEANQDSQIHCYYQDGEGAVFRLFPNRFTTDSIVSAGETLILPESDQWKIEATLAGKTEDFMCIAITPEWFDQLSVIPLLPDLQPIATTDLSQIYNRYKEAMGPQLIKQSISIAVR